MEIKNITLKLTETEVDVIFDALESHIREEAQLDYIDKDDIFDYLDDEITLASQLALNFNKRFFVPADKDLEESIEFESATEFVKYYYNK